MGCAGDCVVIASWVMVERGDLGGLYGKYMVFHRDSGCKKGLGIKQ